MLSNASACIAEDSQPLFWAPASGTGFLPGGIGWYRKTFTLPASARGRKVSVRFDGVYRDGTVWINGVRLGKRPYGYITFEYELTPHLRYGASKVIAVRVDHSVIADSRWYSGSGIYRHVWLNVTGPVHIAPWAHMSRRRLTPAESSDGDCRKLKALTQFSSGRQIREWELNDLAWKEVAND